MSARSLPIVSPTSPETLALLREAQDSPSLVFLSGFHAIKHALRFGAEILCIVTTDIEKLQGFVKKLAPDFFGLYKKGVVELIPEAQIQSLHENRLHWTGVWAVAKRPEVDSVALLQNTERTAPLVLLEDPKNAGNLGASIRVAAALGASGLVVIGKSDQSDPWAPRVVQGASGLHFALPIGRIPRLEEFSGTLVMFDPEGADISSVAIPKDALFLFGTERGGITDATKERGALKVRIPMREGVSSLNLATSVSIALYSVRSSLIIV